MAGGPRSRSDASVNGTTTPPLGEVLPLLLLNDHLAADTKVACFGVEKGMAELLLRNAACTKLMLKPGGAVPAGASSSNSNRGSRASVKAAQQLAAQSSNVALALHGGLLTPAACLWQRITTIHLDDVRLSPQDVSSRSQLQLHKLPHLHTLSLQACHITEGPATQPGPAAASSDRTQPGPAAASSVRTLKCMHCTFSSASLLRIAQSLVGPDQLQTLITDDNEATGILAQLPALQEVQLSGDWLYEGGLLQLLQHPGLTRVSLPALNVIQNLSAQPCTWSSLTLMSKVNYINNLADLPLANIQSCTVRGLIECSMEAPWQLDKAISNANSCPHLVFQPTTEQCSWTPVEPTFTIRNASNDENAPRLIDLVVRHLSCGALMVSASHIRDFLSPDVVTALAAAPTTLTTMGFPICLFDRWGLAEEVETGLFTRMPAQITHVVFTLRHVCATRWWPDVLRWFFKGVTRPMRLTLSAGPYATYIWPAATKQGVQEWLSTHTSNQVQVTFQCRQED